VTPEQGLRGLLPRLNAAIEREVMRLRARYQLSLDEFRGLYVTDEQIDALLRSAGFCPSSQLLPPIAPPPAWALLCAAFGLDTIEQDLLALALAPEIDTRFPTFFAYLNDDAARRIPTVDLAMRLFGDSWEARGACRARLAANAPLVRRGLLRLEPDPPSLSGQGFSIAPLAARHLLGFDVIDGAHLAIVPTRPAVDPALAGRFATMMKMAERPTIILAGRRGAGRTRLADAIAASLGHALAAFDFGGPGKFSDALLAAELTGTALIVSGDLPPPDVADHVARSTIPVFVRADDPAAWERALAGLPVATHQCAMPPFDRRRNAWREALRAEGVRATPAAVAAAAGRFRIAGTAIRHAARDVRLARHIDWQERANIPLDALISAARRQSSLDLGELATRVRARPNWGDLVLTDGVRRQLLDLANAAAQRDRVFNEWGMARAGGSGGQGVAALFAGASGTGKTMSAAAIAAATGLDLWRIDLSAVVSKYIGETEKNLEKIFTAARAGDAILLFDEADALFGRRSEVSDAHDRYANIEVAYLLQRLEDFDGIAILSSNFAKNVDQAFIRRLHYIIEFPLPDASLREQLWRKTFAPGLPLGNDIDFAFIARQFTFSGGDIRAAALDAAFLAAGDGDSASLRMTHIVRAVSRQMLKQGRLPTRGDFGIWQEAAAMSGADTG
jgi:hypothetical protein